MSTLLVALLLGLALPSVRAADGEGHLDAGGAVDTRVVLDAGHAIRVTVEQRGADVAVAVLDASGATLVEADDVPALAGAESLVFVAATSATYTLRVRAAKNSPPGNYSIETAAPRPATAEDKAEAEASALVFAALAAAETGDGAAATTAAERALSLRGNRFGLSSVELSRAFYAAGAAAEAAGDATKAGENYQRSVEIGERFGGKSVPELARPLTSLAILAYGRSDLPVAIELGERALAISEQAYGASHVAVADALTNMAAIYLAAAEFDKAEARQKRAIELYERALGPDDPALANAVNTLAVLYDSRERFDEAEALHKRALAIREKALGPDSPEVANSLFNLGLGARMRGDYARSTELQERALAIREKAYGPDHPEVALSIDALATLARLAADYARAQTLYDRALASAERAYGKEHPRVGLVLANRAALNLVRGDYDTAERDFQRALAILEKGIGPDHPYVGTLLMNYGVMLRYAGRNDEAIARLERASAIVEAKLGTENPTFAQTLDELGAALMRTDPARARTLFARSLAIREKTSGPQSYEVAASLASIGSLARRERRFDDARAAFDRMLAIAERLFGDAHPDVGRAYGYLSELAWATGDAAKAVELRKRGDAAAERDLARNLASGSERQKVLYLDLWTRDVGQALSLHLAGAATNREAARTALGTILLRKGRALDAMSRTIETLRERGTAEDRALLDELAETRARLSAVTLAGPGKRDAETYRRELDALQRLEERLETRAGGRFAEYRASTLPVTVDAVRAAIPEGAALVEIASYFPYDPKTLEYGARRYAAYVTARTGDVSGIDLGDAARVDALATSLRDAIRARRDDRKFARELDEIVFRPVRAIAGPSRHLLVAPDGALNLVPFAALVDERDKRLVESYTITYLTSGRDLLRLALERPAGNAPVVLAAPDFGGETTRGAASRSVRLKPGASDAAPDAAFQLFFPALPGTAEEARSVARALPGARLLLGAEATKRALLDVHGPRVLHVATHGFFLSADESAEEDTRRVRLLNAPQSASANAPSLVSALDPLIRSGLAFAGANEVEVGRGVLTALEATGLDLWGTRLAVLSACDTGVGEVRSGEGVYGLRRALVLAGSESQLMSLWPVSDAATRQLMTDYYHALGDGRGRGEALRDVQLRMLRDPNRRAPYYWASFIQSGDWRPLADGSR